LSEIFGEKGDYVLTITVAGDGAQTRTVELQFNWTGNWQTSFLHFADKPHTIIADSPRKLLRRIEIRDALDELIEQGQKILAMFNGRNDALLSATLNDQALLWLGTITEFVKTNLDVEHVDKLSDYGKTVKNNDRYHITFNLCSAGINPDSHPIPHEMANKLQVLRYFRDEIR
jgi:hypothetical protein